YRHARLPGPRTGDRLAQGGRAGGRVQPGLYAVLPARGSAALPRGRAAGEGAGARRRRAPSDPRDPPRGIAGTGGGAGADDGQVARRPPSDARRRGAGAGGVRTAEPRQAVEAAELGHGVDRAAESGTVPATGSASEGEALTGSDAGP